MSKDKLNIIINKKKTLSNQDVQFLSILVKKKPFFEVPKFLLLKKIKEQNKTKHDSLLEIFASQVKNRAVFYDFLNKEQVEIPDTHTQINEKQPVVQKKVEKKIIEKKKVEKKIIEKKIQEIDLREDTASKLKDDLDTKVKKEIRENEIKHRKNEHKTIKSKTIADEVLQKINKIKQKKDNIEYFQDVKSNEIQQRGRKKKKHEQIDEFIKKNPKISKVKKTEQKDFYEKYKKNLEENQSIYTESLAKIYIKQAYYDKAIEVFEQLKKKSTPTKKKYYNDQIKEIKQLNKIDNK